jgi:hypothetical protein
MVAEAFTFEATGKATPMPPGEMLTVMEQPRLASIAAEVKPMTSAEGGTAQLEFVSRYV